jgi:hypothetical protein
METYAAARKLVHNPDYPEQRKRMLSGLSNAMIDEPIVDIVNGFNAIPCCFTIQCCFGHFIHDKQPDPHNVEALPATDAIAAVLYCIAYICFCIENSQAGRGLLKNLQEVTHIDPENVQCCSADWFWERQVNTYALQVMPDRFKTKDKQQLDYTEALHIEKTRNAFFTHLRKLLQPI